MKKRPDLTELHFDKWTDALKTWIVENVSPFKNDTPEKQKKRIARSKADRIYFFKTYLPHYFDPNAFEDFHDAWSALADLKNQIIPVAAPRFHSKSTFFTFGVPIHDICHELRDFDVIISDSGDQAIGFTLPIKLELEENPRIRHDFGNLVGSGKWQQGDFVTANDIRVLALGSGEKVRGLKHRQHRPDRIIIDDLENDQNVKNPKLVKAKLDWLLQAVRVAADTEFSFIMVGNKFAPKSVLDQLLTAKDENGQPRYQGVEYDVYRPDGTPLWPAVWSHEKLGELKHDIGTVRFNKEMRNRVGAEDSPFKETWFVFIPRVTIFVPSEWRTAAFLDPSGKRGEQNDFKAIVCVGRAAASRYVDVLHAWIRHASVNEMWRACWEIDEEYGCGMGVEINMFQDFLIDSYQAYAERANRWLRLVKVLHATDKEARIVNRLSSMVEYGRLRFQEGQSDQDLLREQLIYILDGNVNDDGPDALEGSVSMLQGGGVIEFESTGTRRASTGGAMSNYMRG